MSSTDLPDDFRRWPKDPYELLRVAHDADRRTVRRAYTELVRRFKPEQFPQEFRAIRDAYESVLAGFEWREQRFAPHADWNPSDVDDSDDLPVLEFDDGEIAHPQPASGADEPSESDGAHPLGRHRDLQDDLDEIWQQAQAGDCQAAYSRLVDLERQFPGRDAIYLRLYWLIVLDPTVDEARTPARWLVQGLRANRLTGRLWELYRRELELHPREALRDECRELLQVRGASPAALADLAEWRWRAAGPVRKWDVLMSDFARLAPIVRADAPDIWARLLLSAVEQMIWIPQEERPSLYAWCSNELEQLDQMSSSMSPIFERLDFLRQVATGWHLMQTWTRAPSNLVGLIRFSWDSPEAFVRRQAVQFAESYLRRPVRLLALLDRVRQCGLGPVAQLQVAFQRAARYDAVDEIPANDRARLGLLVRRAFSQRRDYNKLRVAVLRFCLEQAVSPACVQAFASQWNICLPDRSRVDDRLASDSALHCTYLALRLFAA